MTSGQIFAQNGPSGVLIADGIIRGDKLPLGSAAPVLAFAAVAICAWMEGDAGGRDGRLEFVPDQMWKRNDTIAVAVLISAAVPTQVCCSLESFRRLPVSAWVIA